MKTKDCIHWLEHISHGFRLPIILSGMIGILHVCASLAFVVITKRLVDIATNNQANQRLTPFILLMIGCMGIQMILGIIESRITISNTIRLKNALRQRIFVRTMESQWSGKEKHHTGDVINRLEEDVRILTDFICSTVPSTAVTLFQLVAAFYFLLRLEPHLAWCLLFIMPIALVISKLYIKRMRKLTQQIRNTDSQVQSHIQEHLQHRNLLRTLEQSSKSANTLHSLQNTLTTQVMQRTDFSLFSRTAVQIGFAAGYATTFLWGILGLKDGSVTFGMMTAFLQLVMQVQRPVVELSRQIPGFVHTLTSAERLAELDNLPQEEHGEPQRLNGNIGLLMENIRFAYPDDPALVIDGFSHNFKPGTLTAIVGETGAGKSTLIRLMLSLLRPQDGNISIYNQKDSLRCSPLTRCNFIYVPQGNTLMSGTIRENLLLGNPNATIQQLKEALHSAVADFVWTLPDGIDTRCGEQGSGLSEGQAQRIAIARGLLHEGGILLLDEPTSALDHQTEQLLIKRLSCVQQNQKTLIMITHNLLVANQCNEKVNI